MWQLIVDKFPSNSKDSRHAGATKSSLFRLLEVFLLRNIVELTAELRDCLVKLHSLPYIEQLARSTLLHRFEDPTTLEMLQSVVTLLSEGKFPHVVVLQLLLAHSQFTPSVYSASKSFGFSQFGMIFRPISSILRSLIVTNTEQNAPHRKNHLQRSELYMQQLEIVKLLRVLFRFGGQQCSLDSEKEIGINCRELLFLLFSSYSATLSEMDLEIYNLMHEIETADESYAGGIAEMDFLWGSAAIKVRKEREKEQDTSSDKMNDVETAKERRRNQFRENLPIDPKLCANTVLYFPYYRTLDKGTSSLNRPHQDNSEHMVEATANNEEIQIYDPAFILRLSIHSLSMGYIDPMESASLGLLAVTFVSMSSPDVEMRKMGYDALGRFKTALEKCQKRKDVIRLRLLLTYLQNGIGEPWQRIPSIIAIFVAETSLILLDPSHDHYSFMSKFLMRSPKANMKCIPLFQNFFWSSSVNFKKDRLWILRLLCVALNSDDDAQICIRNSIFEIVLSFYASPLSDNESKELILQVVKKSIKLHKLSRYLVEHCGLISWLSSVVSFFCEKLYQDQMIISFTQLTMVLGVVHDVISSGNAIEWLQKYALEQLTELSSRLYKLLVGDIKLIKENIPLVNSILQILTSSLRISQKRKIYQPHFTLSIEGLFQIYEAVDACSNGVYCPTMDYGLKAVLMSSPPEAILYVNREKLLKFLRWAISSALHATSTKVHQAKESYRHSTIFFDEEESEDSMISKLLRWLTASIIRGKVSKKFNDCDSVRLPERSNLQKLQSLLEHNENGFGENHALFGSEDILAAAIFFYLQQYIGINCRVFPSVVAALSLVFPATSISD